LTPRGEKDITTASTVPLTREDRVLIEPTPRLFDEAQAILDEIRRSESRKQVCEWTMGDAPGPICSGVREILPSDAKDVHIVISWEGSPPQHTF